MWIRLASFALCLAGFTAPAQSANESVSGLESCIQAAHLADAICSNLPNDPAQRVDCFKKAQTTQLECLERVLSEASARSAAPKRSSETARPTPQVDTTPPEASLEADRTDQPAVSIGSAPADEAAKRSSPSPKSAPASVPPSVAEAPTATIRSDTSGKKNDRPAQGPDWILSETTSPVDYSPLINAVIRATSDVKDGPNGFAVRCRAQHTELSIRTDGAWAAPRGNDLVVDYQIDDRPVIRQPWILSTDGKTATYKNDPVELLRSIPEGATLKVAVADKGRDALRDVGINSQRRERGEPHQWDAGRGRRSKLRDQGAGIEITRRYDAVDYA